MTTIRFRQLLPVLALLCLGAGAAPDLSIPSDQVPSTPAPGAALAAEPPYVGDPMVLTAEQRAERSLRTIQIALERTRSNSVKDEDDIVCLKQMPTGSHRPVINCATNGFWRKIRENSLANFTGSGGGGSAKKEDKVFTMSMDDYAKLEKRFGKLPPEMRSLKD
jgi:hypothetical protein